jgi:hypothetical protein
VSTKLALQKLLKGGAGEMIQMVEYVPSKCKALSKNTLTAKKEKKRKYSREYFT